MNQIFFEVIKILRVYLKTHNFDCFCIDEIYNNISESHSPSNHYIVINEGIALGFTGPNYDILSELVTKDEVEILDIEFSHPATNEQRKALKDFLIAKFGMIEILKPQFVETTYGSYYRNIWAITRVNKKSIPMGKLIK